MNIRTTLIEKGFIAPHDMPNNAGEYKVTCFQCGKDKLYVSGLGKGLHCKTCDVSMSWKSFMRRYEPPSPEEIALENFVSYTQEMLLLNKEAFVYLTERGITSETIQKARIGYCPPSSEVPDKYKDEASHSANLAQENRMVFEDRITFPYIVGGMVETIRARSATSSPKYLGLLGYKSMVYEGLGSSYKENIHITEGEIDCLTLQQQGFNSVGVPGVNQYSLIQDVAGYGRKLYICFDGDKAASDAKKVLIQKLNEVHTVELPEGTDVNEYIQAFGAESFQQLVSNSLLYVSGHKQEPDNLESVIDVWTSWAMTNKSLLGPKISWAPRLEKALSGWSTGLFLIAATANAGKSCWLSKVALRAAQDNPQDTIVAYLSLDDEQSDIITRLVALSTDINFELVRSPKWSFDNPNGQKKPDMLKKFFTETDKLKELKNLFIRDAKYGRSLGYIRNYLASLRQQYPDKHIVFIIDSLAKITAEGTELSNSTSFNWKAYLAQELKFLSTLNRACIITPTDLRKLNDFRRPTNDDLKDASELAYEANCILLGFNELHIKNDPETTTQKWTDKDGSIWPILELNLSKNKKTLFRGNIRFRFRPGVSDFEELTIEEEREFNTPKYEARTDSQPSGSIFRADRFVSPIDLDDILPTGAFPR